VAITRFEQLDLEEKKIRSEDVPSGSESSSGRWWRTQYDWHSMIGRTEDRGMQQYAMTVKEIEEQKIIDCQTLGVSIAIFFNGPLACMYRSTRDGQGVDVDS
jgi:hypothetical protein